jgi:glutathione-regulated potassium-efflux system ancillary protein KefG
LLNPVALPPRRVLVVFAHPALERSRVNRHLVDAARKVPGVTIHDLYEKYPSFNISARREQQLLLEHDAVVFQHPFYWYSVPAILKEWQDIVLEHGWAYGVGGTQLEGKVTFNAMTTGGPEQAYAPSGFNNFSLRQFLAPWEQTANLCKMKYLAPFAVHAALQYSSVVELAPHLTAYQTLLTALTEDRLDLNAAAKAEKMAFPVDGFLLPRLEAAVDR